MDLGVPVLPFFLAAIPAVLISALGKGGLGNAMGVMAVPLMSLVISPVQAAAVLLPLLLVMDMFAIWGWWRFASWNILKIILVPGLLGVGIGWLTFYQLPEDTIRLLVGILAVLFCVQQYISRKVKTVTPDRIKGFLWACVSGFTSFGVHAGGAPLSVFLLPLKLNNRHSPPILTFSLPLQRKVFKVLTSCYNHQSMPPNYRHQLRRLSEGTFHANTQKTITPG